MIPLKQKNVRVFAGGIQKALCETALTEYAEGNGVVRIVEDDTNEFMHPGETPQGIRKFTLGGE